MSQINIFGSETSCGATLSPCRKYRYMLWREWDPDKDTCVFIGLNPSTADESDDDPTIRRCIRFARDWGFGRLMMVNLFAIRATDPSVMKTSKEPIGSENDSYLISECGKASLVVAAWGNNGSHMGRSKEVTSMLSGIEIKCFKMTAKNQPVHPLYQAADATLIKY